MGILWSVSKQIRMFWNKLKVRNTLKFFQKKCKYNSGQYGMFIKKSGMFLNKSKNVSKNTTKCFRNNLWNGNAWTRASDTRENIGRFLSTYSAPSILIYRTVRVVFFLFSLLYLPLRSSIAKQFQSLSPLLLSLSSSPSE